MASDLYGIKCLSLEAVRFVQQWFEEFGTESPFSLRDIENEENLGIWCWRSRYPAGWYHLDKELAKLNELKSKFE